MTKKSMKIARWVSLTILMATSARVIYSVYKYKKSEEKLSAIMPRVCSLCGKDHFLQNLERLQDGPFCKQLYTPLATSDDVHCENEFAHRPFLAEMPETNDKICSSCEHANKRFAKKSISASKTIKRELNWSERLLWLMFPHWYAPVAISHNQVSLQRVNHNRQNELNKSNLAVSNVKEDNISSSGMKELDKELTDTECNGNTHNIKQDKLNSKKKEENETAKTCYADNTDAEAVSNSATITKFAEALQTLLPSPGRRPTVAVIECPLHADIKIDAELLWEALQSDESVYVDGLIDVVIIETDSTNNLANEFNAHSKFHDDNCDAVRDDDDDALLCKIVNAKTEGVTTATSVTDTESGSRPTAVEEEIKFTETIPVKEERKRPSLNVNDIIIDTMERKKITPEFLRFSLCDAYSFYTTFYAASFLQLYDDEVVSELNSFCDEANRRGSIHSKGEGQFVSVTHECSAQSFSVSFLPSNHWNEPPETPTSPVQRLVKAISEFPHTSPLRSPSKLLQPPNKMFSRVELEHYNVISNNSSNNYTDLALGTYYLNTANICVKCDSTGKHENYNDNNEIKHHNGHDEIYHPQCNDTNHERSIDLSHLNNGNEQLKKCTSSSKNKNGVSELDLIDSKCVKNQDETEEIPQLMPKTECCHYTVHESTTYHIYVLHQGRSSQVATAALEELLANMRLELHEANLFSQVATNTQKESGVSSNNNNNNKAKQSLPHTHYSHGNDKFDFLTFCAHEEKTELENRQEPEMQELHELYKQERKIDKDREEITHNGFYIDNNKEDDYNNNCRSNNMICTPNTSTANLHAMNNTVCMTEKCAKMRQLKEQLCYHSQLRTNIIEHLRSHHLTRLVEIELPDMRVYRQTPPCIPRATAAFARGFNIYKTFALEMFMQEREWREQQIDTACTIDSDNTSNTQTEKNVFISDNNINNITERSKWQTNKNTQNDSNDKYMQMENYTLVQSKLENEQCQNDVLEHEPNAMPQFCTEYVEGESFCNEETICEHHHHLLKRTNNLCHNCWRKICCFASSTSTITGLFASNNLLLSTDTAAAGNKKIKLYTKRTKNKKYDNGECEEEWEEERKEQSHYTKNDDVDHQNSSSMNKNKLQSSAEYNNVKTNDVSCVYKCMNKDYTEHVHVEVDEHDEINVPPIEPQINFTNSHKHISSSNNNSDNCYSMANHTSVFVNTHNRAHTYSYHTRCSEKQQTHAERSQLKITTSHYSIPQTPLDTSSSLSSSGNTLINYDASHESNTRAGQTTGRPHIIKGERTMNESNTMTLNMAKEHTRLPCPEETADDKKPETLESSETIRTMCTMDGNENVTEYLFSSYRDARQLTWVPSREHAAIFYTLGDVNAALFDAATQPLTEQDEWYLQPSGQSLSSSTITNASSLQEAMSSHHSSASLQYVINKQNEALQKDTNGTRETEHVYKSDGVGCNHMNSELWYTMNPNMNISTTLPTTTTNNNNNIHHISSGSNKTNSNNSNHHNTKNSKNNNANSNSSGFLEYWSQKLPWVPWSETSSIGKLQEQVEQTHIWDEDQEKMHQSYEYGSFHKNNPLNVESPTSGNVNDEYEKWVEHCQCVSYNRNVHFYTLFWHLHRMFYERITKLQRQYAELNYTANNNNNNNNNNEHNTIDHKPEPLWSPLEINGSNQPADNKVANVCVESMNVNGDLNEHSCNVHNSTGATVKDSSANASAISKTSVRLWIIAKLTSTHHLLVHRLSRWCQLKWFTSNHNRDTHMCSREHTDDVNIRKSANNAATTTTQLPDNDNNHKNKKKKNTNQNKKNNMHTSKERISSTNHTNCSNNCNHHHHNTDCNDDGKEELKENNYQCDNHDNTINEEYDANDDNDDVIIDFNGHRRKRVDLPTSNGQYGLAPFEVWLATRYSTKIAAEVYLMDVLASKGDHFYSMSTVLDEILYHAILFYHNGNLRDFVDDLLTNFNLEYIPHTKWGEEVLTSSTIRSCSTEEHEGSCPSSESQQGNHISRLTEEHTRCCQTYKPFAPEQQQEEQEQERLQNKIELESSEQLPHEHLTQVYGNVEYKSNHNLRAAVTEKNKCASDNHSGSASRSSSLSSRTSQYCSKTSCQHCTQSSILMLDDANDKTKMFSSTTTNVEEHECKERSHETCTCNADEKIVHSSKINICSDTITAAEAGEATTLNEDTKIDEIITLYDVAVKMLEHQRSICNNNSSGKCNVQRNWNTQSSVSSTALYCNLSESCSLRQAKIDELEALRLLECEMKYIKEFIMNNRNSLLSATLTAQGANKLEGVFGVPATVFPFVLCARESISVVHNVFLGMNKCYGTLRFSSFTTFIRDVFSRDRPEVIRHAPRIFRTLNKSRRGYINFEELCGWFARKLSCGNNIRPNMHFIATCMTLRLLLLLLLDQKPLWPYLECTVESLSDGET